MASASGPIQPASSRGAYSQYARTAATTLAFGYGLYRVFSDADDLKKRCMTAVESLRKATEGWTGGDLLAAGTVITCGTATGSTLRCQSIDCTRTATNPRGERRADSSATEDSKQA